MASLKRRGAPAQGMPSLIKALSAVIDRRSFQDVLRTCRDRRQLAVVASAWVGVSESELLEAISTRLGIGVVEKLDPVTIDIFGDEPSETIERLQTIGAYPLAQENVITGYACVDPAELRSVPGWEPGMSVVLARWAVIDRRLDQLQEEVEGRAATHEHARLNEVTVAAQAVLDFLKKEVSSYGATSVDVFFDPERTRYQFVSRDGRRGVGNICSSVVSGLRKLFDAEIATPAGDGATPSVERLGDSRAYRLSWSAAPSIVTEVVNESREAPLAGASVQVPAAAPHRRVEEPSPSTRGPDASPEHRAKVFVVDDNLMFARILERFLGRYGISTRIFTTATAARLELERELPDLLVSDLHMPETNGADFIKSLRAVPAFKDLPIIMLTSDDDANAEINAFECGADGFVTKSKDPRILCVQINRMIDQRQVKKAA